MERDVINLQGTRHTCATLDSEVEVNVLVCNSCVYQSFDRLHHAQACAYAHATHSNLPLPPHFTTLWDCMHTSWLSETAKSTLMCTCPHICPMHFGSGRMVRVVHTTKEKFCLKLRLLTQSLSWIRLLGPYGQRGIPLDGIRHTCCRRIRGLERLISSIHRRSKFSLSNACS